jgi:hypothetical protein
MRTFGITLMALAMSTALPAFAQSAPAPVDSAQWQDRGGEVWLNVGGFSRHFSRGNGYNENNLGLGAEYRTSPEVSYMAGAYYNSVRKTTTYAAINWQPWTVGPFKLGATVGVMDGYPSLAKGGTFFAAVPMATWEGKRYGINVGIIPSIGKVDGAVIVQFKLRVY